MERPHLLPRGPRPKRVTLKTLQLQQPLPVGARKEHPPTVQTPVLRALPNPTESLCPEWAGTGGLASVPRF